MLDCDARAGPGVASVEAKPPWTVVSFCVSRTATLRTLHRAVPCTDGTINDVAYSVLLHDPSQTRCCRGGPENQLYPALLRELAEEVPRLARRGGQVFVSTHSPDFLNGAKLDEIYWFVKQDGFATVRRASASKLLRDLYAEGDLPGALWKQRLFEGADPA